MGAESRSAKRWILPAAILVPLVAIGLLRPGSAAGPASVVVTTSMLECAVEELAAAAAGIEVVRLVPPGACPGHFDLSPRAVPVLRSAPVVIRHDYQQFLESKLIEMGVADARVVVAETGGSLLVPEHYAALVRRVAEIFAELVPERTAELAAAADRVGGRLGPLGAEIRQPSPPWRGARVIASVRQAEFSRWLGLEVLAEIGRGEEVSPRELERLLGLRPALVVANLQEGPRAAAVLAERLEVPLVVFSNFPGADGYGDGYDRLLRSNLEQLEAAWASGGS